MKKQSRKKYGVLAMQRIGREDVDFFCRLECDTPEEAVEAWFRLGVEAPTETSISCLHKEDAIKLVTWANENRDCVCRCYTKYDSCYSLQFLLDAIEDQVKVGCRSFLETKQQIVEDAGYSPFVGDMIYPFCIG